MPAKRVVGWVMVLLGTGWARPASTAGFAVAEQGAEALGVAGAATARLSLAEIGFYNPAGWVGQPGVRATAGASAILANINHRTPGEHSETSAHTPPNIPPYVYAGYGINQWWAVGLAFNVPFGNSLSWPTEEWPGRFEVTKIQLRVFELAPSVAYRPFPWLRLAVGPRGLWSDVIYARKVDAVASEGRVKLSGAGRSMGGQAAVAAGPFDGWTFGLTYRSRARLEYDGNARFSDIPPELTAAAHDQDATTKITVPDRLAFGAAFSVAHHIVSLDLEYTAWRTFETFAVNFADPATPDVAQPRDWHDTLAARVGYEYTGLAEHGLKLRAGVAYDPTPSPATTLSPSLPDSTRGVITAGATYRVTGGLRVSLAGGHVFFTTGRTKGTDAFPGVYHGYANLLSMGVAYEWQATSRD